MEGSIKDLAKYRFKKAKEDLETARMNYDNAMYKASRFGCNIFYI